METTSEIQCCSLEWLLQYRECLNAPERECLARHEEGQTSEIWDVNGGADAMWGFTVLWVPEERIAWAFNCGLDAQWYGNVGHPRDFETFFSDHLAPLVELPYYVGLSVTCEDCRTRLTAEERHTAHICAEAAGDKPHLVCEPCEMIRIAELVDEDGLLPRRPQDALGAL
jgi:hypothetical protein